MSQNFMGGYGGSGTSNGSNGTNNSSYLGYSPYHNHYPHNAADYRAPQTNSSSTFGPYPYSSGSTGGYFDSKNIKLNLAGSYGGTTPTSTVTSAKIPLNQQPVKAATASSMDSYIHYDPSVYYGVGATTVLASKATGNGSPYYGAAGSRGLPPALTNTSSTRGFSRSSYPVKRPLQQRQSASAYASTQYCEICKISCASLMTYREHMEGQKHKRRAELEIAGNLPMSKSKPTYRCEVCGVSCSGQDAYGNHVKGAKHLRTVKLHENMGKPIPSQPTVIVPKDAKKDDGSGADGALNGGIFPTEVVLPPVGENYIEKGPSEDDPKCLFICRLCDCRFTDATGKDSHVRGRRHRVQYKKKVDPTLDDAVAPKQAEKSVKKTNESLKEFRRDPFVMRQYPLSRFEFETSMSVSGRAFNRNFFASYGISAPEQSRLNVRLSPYDMAEADRHVMAKHLSVYPTEEELVAVNTVVSDVETALKAVSDVFAEEKTSAQDSQLKEAKTAEADSCGAAVDPKPSTEDPQESINGVDKERLLKGVMRVGVLAKGLLMRGDLRLQLVVLCSEKPTANLLTQVHQLLQTQLQKQNPSEYELSLSVDLAVITVVADKDPKVCLSVMLTSVLMRGESSDPSHPEASTKPEPTGVLSPQKCLEALALLRQAKWFQARCSSVPSCLLVLRVMRELCKRVTSWSPLSNWALELLVEKVLTSSIISLSPGEAVKRVLEAIAAGILLPGSPGLLDPCEKESVDAIEDMTAQQREDITASAQKYLRLIAFKRIHLVLGMEKLPLLISSLKDQPKVDVTTDVKTVVTKIMSNRGETESDLDTAQSNISAEPES